MAKYTGKGSDFLVKGASAYETISQIQSIGSIQETAAEVDVSTLDAGDYRDYIQGFKETGEAEVVMIFDPALVPHGSASGVVKKFQDGDTLDCAIKIGSTPPYYMTFQAFIRDLAWPEFNVDDPVLLTPTFRLRTPVTLTSALPT